MLDIRTLLVLIALSVFFMTAAMLAAGRAYPDAMRRATSIWALANGVQVASWLLLALRGRIPDLIAVVVADTVFVLSVAMLYRAIAIFMDRPLRWRWTLLAPGLVCLGAAYWTYLQASVGARSLLIGIVAGALALVGAVLPARIRLAGTLGEWVVRLTMLALAMTLGGRVLYLLLAHPANRDLFSNGAGDALFWAALYVIAIARMYGWVLMCGDRLNAENLRLATYDALTGVMNRRSIEELARRAFASARRAQSPLSLLLIDLDHFKSINDTHGHAEGDAVLKAFARVAGAALRAGDALGRFGGEEFLVLLPGAAGAEALQAAERLRALVAHEIRVGAEGERPLTISIGVAEALSADLDVEAVIRRADAALYEAKAHGRNRVVALGDLARAAGG